MNEDALRSIFKSLANEGVPPAEVDLWPRIESRVASLKVRGRNRRLHQSIRRVAAVVILAIVFLVLGVAIVGPERALAALRGLRGYIPGIGLVDKTAALRVLADPVSLERDGIRVTVEQAVLDSQRTVIIYQADGIPAAAYPREEQERPRNEVLQAPPYCYQLPELRLADGTALIDNGAQSGGWGSGYKSRLVYPAVPGDVDQATFFVPCLQDTAPGAAPENWELKLRFVPAPPGMTIAPVAELSPTAEATTPDEASAMGLYLERVIELEDSYILVGTFRQGEALPGANVHGISEWPKITDANGRALANEVPSDLDLFSEEFGVFPWSYRIAKGFAPPLTITLEAVDTEFLADVQFEFDAGADPGVGQEWALDQEFDVAGHKVRLVSAVRLENGYEFRFESDASVLGVSVMDIENEPVAGFGGGQLGESTVGFQYGDPVPTGLLSFRIRGLFARYSGPWTLTWEPPDGG